MLSSVIIIHTQKKTSGRLRFNEKPARRICSKLATVKYLNHFKSNESKLFKYILVCNLVLNPREFANFFEIGTFVFHKMCSSVQNRIEQKSLTSCLEIRDGVFMSFVSFN